VPRTTRTVAVSSCRVEMPLTVGCSGTSAVLVRLTAAAAAVLLCWSAGVHGIAEDPQPVQGAQQEVRGSGSGSGSTTEFGVEAFHRLPPRLVSASRS